MAYDEALANRIGVVLKDPPNVVGKKCLVALHLW